MSDLWLYWAFGRPLSADETQSLEGELAEIASGLQITWGAPSPDYGIGGGGDIALEVLQIWVPTALSSAASAAYLAEKVSKWFRGRKKDPAEVQRSIIMYGPNGTILMQVPIDE